MSNQYYNNIWQETVNDVQDLIQVENFQNEPDFLKKPAPDLYQYYAQNYIRYINIFKKLEDCYDQIVHPQKRIHLKELLELVIIRMIENKKSLINYNTHSNNYQSDMVNLDELITDLKLTPDHLEVPIPRYFKKETDKERLDERNQVIDKLLLEFHDTCEPEEIVYQEKVESPEENATNSMINLIQVIERGRQGIVRGLLAKQTRKDRLKKEAKNKKLAEGEEITEEQERESAILLIEKYWRCYKGREQVYSMRKEEMEFLGIKKESEDPTNPQSQFQKTQEQRLKMTINQEKNQQEYEKAKVELKKLVKEVEGPEIKEKKIKERIDWIDMKYEQPQAQEKLPARAIDYYDQKKRLPPTLEELEALKGGKKGKPKETKDGGKKGKKGKKDKKEEKKETIDLTNVIKINEQVDQYLSTWGSTNESENFAQTYVTDLAKGMMRNEVDFEMNGLVDELIEIELDNRHLFLLKKPRKRPPKPKPPKPKKPKPFKVPGAGGQKGRNPLDMLAELVDAKIVRKLMPAKLTDLMGGQNVLGAIQEQQFPIAPDPSFAQLRAALAEFVAMPLGSPILKEKLDRLVYFLFFGPKGSGKTLAIRALATECNAMLIDLTPSNIPGRIGDKAGIGKTFYMAFSVAKHFHPSIIFMDEIDQVFGPMKKKKGVPAALWKNLKKPLQDFKKQKFIEPTSRVVFIGCTNTTSLMTMKDTKAYFERKFFFPKLNYDTRLMILDKYFEEKKVKLEQNFPLSTLAHISDGYTAGAFRTVFDKVLTAERIKRLGEEPLKIDEFITPLTKAPFIRSQAEYDALRAFFDEVTGTKERRERAKAPAVDPKKKGKGKGK